ncbi:MAG TPA: glycosyltransferase family 4 protein [Egibacteraceae bacterium]|nr:glycosyltransferase family 4 protein [Egibacteraceae bacterium]
MRIALVCPYDWLRHGGVRGHVENLAAHLAPRHTVRILAPASGAVPEEGVGHLVVPVGRPVPVPYNRSVAPVSPSPLAARRTLQALRSFRPDVVHVHEPLVPLVSAAASAFGPAPVVGTFHAWSDADRLYRFVAPVGRRVVRRLAARLAVSPSAQTFVGEALRLPLGSFQVVPNGVDVSAYADAEPFPELADPARPLLLFVGRLEPRKGLDVAIRAFLRVHAADPSVRLCVVGEGPERRRCQDMVPGSLRPHVLFVGAVPEAEKPRYLASADVLIAPNRGGESFGIVLLEAMAAGLPVVASNIPGFRGVVKDARQGRLVPPGDALAVADAVGTLLANAHLRRAMAAEGRRTAARYDLPVVGAEVEAVYRRVAGRP